VSISEGDRILPPDLPVPVLCAKPKLKFGYAQWQQHCPTRGHAAWAVKECVEIPDEETLLKLEVVPQPAEVTPQAVAVSGD